MSNALDGIRVEVAFSADPNTTTPAFVDLTTRTSMVDSIEITRGRSDEFDTVQTGSCDLTFDNTDGALTPGNASSPFYPNVKPQNRVRVSYHGPGNMLPAASASFESGTVGSWAAGGSVPPTLSNSAVRAFDGTKSMLITWGTGGTAQATHAVTTVVGRTYTVSGWAYVPAGSPGVLFVVGGIGIGRSSTVVNAWTQISFTFVATSTSHTIAIWPATGTTAGQQAWLDAIMFDEGAAVGPFTTTAPPADLLRFDGYVDGWPVQWPTGGKVESSVTVTAYDITSRVARARSLGSVIAETVRARGALFYLPLDEGSEARTVGDRSGSGATLALASIGTGGEVDLGGGTGPATDGASAPLFTPASATAGFYLAGDVPALGTSQTGAELAVTFRAETAPGRVETFAMWEDVFGTGVLLGLDAAGHVTLSFVDAWNPGTVTVTSATVFADNATHDVSAQLYWPGGVNPLEVHLFVDGVERGTYATVPLWHTVPNLSHLTLGGSADGDLFAGTVAQVTGYVDRLSTTERADRQLAVSTGFAGERSDERIARILGWIGLPAGLQDLDVGLSTIGHVDCTGKGPLEYLQDVATTEAGLVFAGTDGRLAFRSRAHTYDTAAAVVATLAADLLGPDLTVATDTTRLYNEVTVTREGGASMRVTNDASVSAYGRFGFDLTVQCSTDAAALDRANWTLSLYSTPVPRIPAVTLDALTDPGTSSSVRALDIGSRIAATGLPSQAPSSTADLRVEGYTESVGVDGWELKANTSPYLLVAPLILDDATFGLLDTDQLVY